MKLEFLSDISDGGRFTNVVANQLVRLYDFDSAEASLLRQAIQRTIVDDRETLELSKLEFITSQNCKVTLQLADTDIGLTTENNVNFICYLTHTLYIRMAELIEPFCNNRTSGYQWLYDTESNLEFLFSPGGTW
ncbi:hypothetical protein HB364_07645 [Pseudoflavitalea sp. X16]|uniref:hypothetical protein n=1 Tax=Paraflavitalea devenefica TaxID=2716334 RepID=UPI00141FFC99|nr:hypothetical protein [Paraflavitalea devenefica]NII24946.1 hypothetical protein [Paraflavitalea devenefica]